MTLNFSQQAAVDCIAPSIVCSAAAGSGKTRVFVERIRRMIRDGTDPHSIVAISFTNVAANEIQKRLGPDVTLGFIGTIHSFILRLLQDHGLVIGLPVRLTVLDEAESDVLLQDCVEKLTYSGTDIALKKEVLKGVDYFRSQCRAPKTDVERVAFEYYWKLMTTGCLTFDMILSLGLELIRKLAMPKLVHYGHLLVDETQDSSEIDWQIYDSLPVKTRFMVADERQRIFSFRGSCDGFEERLAGAPENGWTALRLEDCYRCGSAIVTAANKLMPRHEPMRSATGSCGDVMVQRYDTATEELVGVAAHVKHCLKVTNANEMAVLVRTNALAMEFRKALESCDVPVRCRKKIEHPLDWRTARSFVSMLTNPENDRLCHKFLELKLGTERAGQMQRESTADFTTINGRFLHIRYMQLADVTSAMVQAGLDRESIGRVRELIESLQPESTLLELQGALQALDEDEQMEGDGVTVTTCHGAKGKEWECVWLPAWEEELFPSKRDASDAESLAEARRLAYVAITRAKSLVDVSWAAKRTVEWKGVQDRKPSRFIEEMS